MASAKLSMDHVHATAQRLLLSQLVTCVCIQSMTGCSCQNTWGVIKSRPNGLGIIKELEFACQLVSSWDAARQCARIMCALVLRTVCSTRASPKA
jgi:hypothetical protein